MPNSPKITHGGDRASYNPDLDQVRLPEQHKFDAPEAYYVTAFHELTHSTGHEDRLDRVKDWSRFGSDPYAQEELVAEMGAAMLAGFADIDVASTQENTKAYIQNWMIVFENDNKIIVQAASQAQKAADYILGPDPEDETE